MPEKDVEAGSTGLGDLEIDMADDSGDTRIVAREIGYPTNLRDGFVSSAIGFDEHETVDAISAGVDVARKCAAVEYGHVVEPVVVHQCGVEEMDVAVDDAFARHGAA